MKSTSVLRRSERREEKNADVEFDALSAAASDPLLRRGSFWADALRDPTFEGASSEERLRSRARLASAAAPRPSWSAPSQLVEPDVIPLPNFDEPPAAPSDDRLENSIDATTNVDCETKTADPESLGEQIPSSAVVVKKERSEDKIRFQQTAQKAFYVGQALILAAFLFLAATLVVMLFIDD